MLTTFRSGTYPGEAAASWSLGGFLLTETRYAGGTRLPRHAHERPCFVGVLAGAFEDVVSREARPCSAGTVLFRSAGEPHSNVFHARATRCINVEIPATWPALPTRSEARFPTTAAGALRGIERELALSDDLSPMAIEGLLLEVSVAVRRASSPPPPSPRIARAREIADDDFASKLRLQDVARVVGLHPAQLARDFRTSYGCTFGEYVRRRRIGFATDEMLRTARPLAEIATSSGFSDQSHFSNTFRAMVGITPRRFRQMRRR